MYFTEQVINIDLSKYNPSDINNAFIKQYDTLTEGNIKIIVSNVSENTGFFLIQIHSYGIPIELSNSTSKTTYNTVNGTNVGLIQLNEGKQQTYEFFLTLDSTKNIHILIAVIPYTNKGKSCYCSKE